MQLDRYVSVDSPIHRWDARWKLGSLFLYTFVCALLESLPLLLLSAASVFTLLLLSRVPIRAHAKGLRPLIALSAAMVPFLLLTAGFETGRPFGSREFLVHGVRFSAIVVLRALIIASLVGILLNTTRLHVLIAAGKAVGIPNTIVAVVLFTYRYIFHLLYDLRRLVPAARLRGFGVVGGIRHFAHVAGIASTMLLRSRDTASRAHAAMRLRGYSGTIATTVDFTTGIRDIVPTVLTVAFSGALVYIEILL